MTKPQAKTLVNRLTARQREVLRGIASSETVQTIGERLGIAVETVYNHRKTIVVKLGTGSNDTAALTRLAILSGVVKAF